MPGLSDFEVPSYLQPPSPGEQERLGMERSQIESQQAEMLQRGFEKMQKKVAMARVMGDAQELQAAGLDPEEARSQALLKSGRGLFDTPDQWNKVSTELEDSIARKRAAKSFHEEIQRGLTQPDENGEQPDPQDVLTRAWMKWGSEISGRAGMQPFVNAQTRANTAANTLRVKSDQFTRNQDRLKQFEADKTDLGQQRVDLGYYKADSSAETADLNRASKERLATGAAKKLPLSDQKEVASIYTEINRLQKAHDDLTAEEGAVKDHPNTIKRMKLSAKMAELRQRAAKISGKEPDNGDASAQPGSQIQTKVGKRYRNADGEIKTYKGEDADGNPIWE